jgi:hypothetical protein
MKLGRQAFALWFLEGKNVEAVVRGTVNIKPEPNGSSLTLVAGRGSVSHR